MDFKKLVLRSKDRGMGRLKKEGEVFIDFLLSDVIQ